MWRCELCVAVLLLSVWFGATMASMDSVLSAPSIQERLNTSDKSRQDVRPFGSQGLKDRFLPPNAASGDSAVTSVCGDGYCQCSHFDADCSGHQGKLTYVPALPPTIDILNFKNNGLTVIGREDFFQNVTNITELDLSNNGLTSISAGVFRFLVKLTYLLLSGNNLRYNTLAPVLTVQTLEILDVGGNPLGTPPSGLFNTYHLPHLSELRLQNATISYLNMSVFTPLPNLEAITLVGNYLHRKTLIPDFLPQLQRLELLLNSFWDFPVTCNGSLPFFPNLTMLDMSLNPFINGPPSASVCLPRLATFVCLECHISEIKTNAFPGHLFPALESVSIGFADPYALVKTHAFNSSCLTEISLYSVRSYGFIVPLVHPDAFAGCPNLETLDLEGSDLSYYDEQTLKRLISHDNLNTLKLVSASIEHISADMFTGLPNLQELDLSVNKLTDLPDGVFDSLKHLETLDLSGNRISVVKETTFSSATLQRLGNVNLEKNPFLCDCDLRWFKQQLAYGSRIFYGKYMCANLVNTTVQSFYVADQACVWSPAVSKFIIASVVLLVLPLTLLATLYRYRWHIRLLLFEAARGRTDRWIQLQQQRCRYDVFVCYDSENVGWVREHLMPELEGRLGLRLCVHERDFTLGVPIVLNIEESVQTSERVMVVLSRGFARSPWCQFELQVCLTHVVEHGDSLIVILLEDIPLRDVTPAMMAVMRTLTYIEWRDEPEARASFWGRIKLALQ